MNTADINRLAGRLSGYLLQPGDPGYDSAISIDNGRIQFRPGVIIFPRVVNDVRLGIKFAAEQKVPFSVKGGGHSAAGYCLNAGGVVLDMRMLNARHFDPRTETVTMGMGVIWYDIYKLMQDTGTGLIPVGGGCPTVAPPGFMLGGGYSFVSRSYGMSIDNLVGLEIVTPDGELHRLSDQSTKQEDKDLWWACRGGGGGNFGVVTEMTIKVRKPFTEKMLVGQIRYPIEATAEVLGVYNEWVEKIPEAMSCYGYMGQQSGFVDPSKRVKVLGLTPVFNGDYAEGLDLLHPLLKLKPLNTDLKNMTLPDWEFFNGNTTKVDGKSAYIRSTILPKGGMNQDVAKVIMKYIGNAPSPDSFAVWTLTGGKIADVAPDATAYFHRTARFVPEIKSIWNRDKPGDELANVEWAYKFFEDLAKAGHATGAYVNYIDPLQHDWARLYYGDNYKRLCEIKKKADPHNLFNFQQGVGSTFNPPPPPLTDLSPLNRTQQGA